MRVSQLYQKMAEMAHNGVRFATATIISAAGSSPRGTGAKMIVLEDGTRTGTIGGDCLENDVVDECVKMLAADKNAAEKEDEPPSQTKIFSAVLTEAETGGVGMLCGGKVDVLIELSKPQLDLVVLGSGPVATSVIKLADFLDIGTTLIDPIPPRAELPKSSAFIKDWHEEGLKKIGATRNTAIVIVTRHKNDVPSLKAALATDAGYIGMIGSKYRVQTIFSRVAKDMAVPYQTFSSRVHAPVGLDLGAETPPEIALSILAEILAHFRKATAQAMMLHPPTVPEEQKPTRSLTA